MVSFWTVSEGYFSGHKSHLVISRSLSCSQRNHRSCPQGLSWEFLRLRGMKAPSAFVDKQADVSLDFAKSIGSNQLTLAHHIGFLDF